jgi:DNA-binding SARP family transcriptional activator
MVIQLLGGFSVSVDGRIVDESAWSLRKVKGLIKLLALAPEHQLHREELMELLWPQLDPDSAANNLHKALHLARRALEPDLQPKQHSLYIRLSGDVVRLEGHLAIDVNVFRQAAATARLSRDAALYEQALSLYAGDLLPDDRYDDWVSGPREELRDLHVSLLMEAAGIWEGQGRVGVALEALRQVVASDPAHEEATLCLMRLLARAGQRHLALRQYLHLRETLRRDLDAEPDGPVQELYDLIRRGHRVPDPPVTIQTSMDSEVDAVPFVGRSAALAQCDGLLADLSRGCGGLVLMRGAAGSGKTRLVEEVARRATQRGVLVLRGAATQAMDAPYAPFMEALDGLTTRLSPSELRVLLSGTIHDLGQFLPSVRAVLGPMPYTAATPDRRRLYAAMAESFGALARRVPIVLILDDLHMADSLSLDLLRYVTRATANLPVLLVGTSTLESDKMDGYGEVEAVAQLIDLAPLDLTETTRLVRSLLRGAVDPEVTEVVQAVARGNPAFTAEAVQALVGRGLLLQRDQCWYLHDGPRPLLSSFRLRARKRA